MPLLKNQEFTIETESEDPKIILEKAKELAGIRAKIDFTVEQVSENAYRIICQSDLPFDFNRIVRNTKEISLVQPKN